MSQEQGLFSVRRPREVSRIASQCILNHLSHTDIDSEYVIQTLGAVSHNVSAIPMPASAMKRSTSQSNLQAPHTTSHVRTTSGSRMSLFHRSSSGGNLADMGFSTVQRPSTANFFNSTGGRKSYAPVSSTPAHPIQFQESTQRRSSVYSARPSAGFGPTNGHQSFFATAPPLNGIPTDPRRLKDASTRAMMSQELMEFLTQRNFEMDMKYSLSPKAMSSPTMKDFDMMFKFLYHCIDPAYRFQKSMDNEVPPLLKQMRYPFERSITKSQLAAVGGNNWYIFLGLLHWMMNLAKMMEQYSTGVYDEASVEAGYDVMADRITFQFLSDAYKEWLSIEDEDENDGDEEAKQRIQPHIDAMAARFEQANQANLEQVRALEAESKALQDQIDELSKSAPKLAKLDETIKVLEEDRVKFEHYNASMGAKVEKYEHRAGLLEEEIQNREQEIQAAKEERDQLQQRVDDQGLSVQDIDRMNTERERLQKGVEATCTRLEESKDRTSKKEVETGTKLDELESAVQRYNSLGYQIGIIPSSDTNTVYEIHLTANEGPKFSASQPNASTSAPSNDRLLFDTHTGYQPLHLTSDLKLVKSSLSALRKEISERRTTALEEDMGKVDMLDKTREALDDKYAEIETLGHRTRAAQEEFDKTREIVGAQNMASDAQIERMEKELSRMRAGVRESVQLMEQREMEVNLEYVPSSLPVVLLSRSLLANGNCRYEQLSLRSSALREELHTELERMLNEIIKFKIHVQASLEGYEEFVAGEVEREWSEREEREQETEAGERSEGGEEGGREEGGSDEEEEGTEVEMELEE